MLITPTVDKLHALGLGGMARALVEQLDSAEYRALSFEDRLGLLVDREAQDRPTGGWSATSRRRSFAPPPASRTSSSITRVGSNAPWCSAWRRHSGWRATRTC
jgi:hypothetical protein